MATVKHVPKDREYHYPDVPTARRHALQAQEQSQGKLIATQTGEEEFTLDRAPKQREG